MTKLQAGLSHTCFFRHLKATFMQHLDRAKHGLSRPQHYEITGHRPRGANSSPPSPGSNASKPGSAYKSGINICTTLVDRDNATLWLMLTEAGIRFRSLKTDWACAGVPPN
jgi:hypothetical protein